MENLSHQSRADDVAFLQYTSGSTERPQRCHAGLHTNLMANIHSIVCGFEFRPEDVAVSWLPLYHDMGLIGAWFSVPPLLRHAACRHVAAGIPEPPGALAAGHPSPSRNYQPRTEFCVRALHPQNTVQGFGGARPRKLLAGGAKWRGARSRKHNGAIRSAVRALWFSSRSAASRLRTGRSVAWDFCFEQRIGLSRGPHRTRRV